MAKNKTNTPDFNQEEVKNLDEQNFEEQAIRENSKTSIQNWETFLNQKKEIEWRTQKDLLEWMNESEKRYMLYPIEDITKYKDQYRKLFGRQLRGNYDTIEKNTEDYLKFHIDNIFECKELGVAVWTYFKERYIQWKWLVYTNGTFVVRADGTYTKWPFQKSKDENERLIWKFENIKVVNNRLIIEDNNGKSIDVGAFELPPIYRVYRNNRTYEDVLKMNLLFGYMFNNYKIVDSKEGIFPQWSDIIENDFIRAIPEGSIIITDNAALRSLPILSEKGKIINLDKEAISHRESNESELLQIWYCIKEFINKNPKGIKIYSHALTDHIHVKWYSGGNTIEEVREKEKNLAIFMKEELAKFFPNTEITISDDYNDFRKSEEGVIKIIDRHRIWDERDFTHYPEDIKKDENTLVLPLSENTFQDERYKYHIFYKFSDLMTENLAKKLEELNS